MQHRYGRLLATQLACPHYQDMASTTLSRPPSRASAADPAVSGREPAARRARRQELVAQADRAQTKMGPGYGIDVSKMSSANFKELTRRLMGRG